MFGLLPSESVSYSDILSNPVFSYLRNDWYAAEGNRVKSNSISVLQQNHCVVLLCFISICGCSLQVVCAVILCWLLFLCILCSPETQYFAPSLPSSLIMPVLWLTTKPLTSLCGYMLLHIKIPLYFVSCLFSCLWRDFCLVGEISHDSSPGWQMGSY